MSGAAGAVEAPDPTTLSAIIPEAATSGPPPAIKAGTRLVYRVSGATILTGPPGAESAPSPGGEGFQVFQVGYVDERIAQISVRSYLRDVITGQTSYTGGTGRVYPAGSAGDMWLHPRVLGSFVEAAERDPAAEQRGIAVVRMPLELGGRSYHAVRIQQASPAPPGQGGYVAQVFDLETGLLLTHDVVAMTPAGERRSRTEFIEKADVAVPWAHLAEPEWVRQFEQLHYRGAETTTTGQQFQHQRPMALRIVPTHRGPGWLRYRSITATQRVGGLPPEEAEGIGSSGRATIGGYWIPPEGLARLQPGLVIDRLEAVGAATSVSAIGGGRVTITETGPLTRIDTVYDAATGVLVRFTWFRDTGFGMTVTYDLELVDGP